MARWITFALVAVAGLACSKASTEGEAKQWPKVEPDKGVPIPPSLSIQVVVDGEAREPITAQSLTNTRPDFADADRKAWRIATLVTDAGTPGSVEAASPTGVRVTFPHPTPEGLEPVLYLTRRGDVIVAALDPKDPFPRWHGEGGRLHRAGDSQPRVVPVARLEITRTR